MAPLPIIIACVVIVGGLFLVYTIRNKKDSQQNKLHSAAVSQSQAKDAAVDKNDTNEDVGPASAHPEKKRVRFSDMPEIPAGPISIEKL